MKMDHDKNPCNYDGSRIVNDNIEKEYKQLMFLVKPTLIDWEDEKKFEKTSKIHTHICTNSLYEIFLNNDDELMMEPGIICITNNTPGMLLPRLFGHVKGR